MSKKIVPPVPYDLDINEQAYKSFLEALRNQVNEPKVLSQTTDPGTTGVPDGTWSVWKNTTSGLVKVWTNDGGVMKSVTLT